jgi:hypothetical protein
MGIKADAKDWWLDHAPEPIPVPTIAGTIFALDDAAKSTTSGVEQVMTAVTFADAPSGQPAANMVLLNSNDMVRGFIRGTFAGNANSKTLRGTVNGIQVFITNLPMNVQGPWLLHHEYVNRPAGLTVMGYLLYTSATGMTALQIIPTAVPPTFPPWTCEIRADGVAANDITFIHGYWTKVAAHRL